ncbi:MAG: hypothetical protein MZV64_52245 [Ignavibacteriales bacterium]|nr:hypothetical protein [Ignavibacteriales bacterium]
MPEWLMKAAILSFAEKEPQPYEFRAKPVWAKSICNYCRRIYESYACLVNLLGSKFLSRENQLLQLQLLRYVEDGSPADSIWICERR